MMRLFSALGLAVALASTAVSANAAGLLKITISGTIQSGYDGPSFFTGDRRYTSLAGYDFRYDVTFDTAQGVISNDYRSFRTGSNVGVANRATATMTVNNRVVEMSGLDSAGYTIQDDGMYIDFQDSLYAPENEGRVNSFFRIFYTFDGRTAPRTIEDDVFMLHYYGDGPSTNFERTDSYFGDNDRLTRFYAGGPITITVDGIPRRAPTPEEPPPTTPVPEPATWALMIVGFGLAGAGLRTRRKAIA